MFAWKHHYKYKLTIVRPVTTLYVLNAVRPVRTLYVLNAALFNVSKLCNASFPSEMLNRDLLVLAERLVRLI